MKEIFDSIKYLVYYSNPRFEENLGAGNGEYACLIEGIFDTLEEAIGYVNNDENNYLFSCICWLSTTGCYTEQIVSDDDERIHIRDWKRHEDFELSGLTDFEDEDYFSYLKRIEA